MAVDDGNGLIVSNTDLIGLDANYFAKLGVALIDRLVAISTPSDAKQPEIRKLCAKRSRDASQRPKGDEIIKQVGKSNQADDSRYCPR